MDTWTLDEFLFSLKASGKAPATIKSRKDTLSKFLRWVQDNQLDLAALSRGDLMRFLSSLSYTPDHINVYVSSLRVFFRWMQEEGLREENPAQRLKYLSAPAPHVDSLTKEEITKLVGFASKKAPKSRFGIHRTAALAMLLLDTGLRIGEALRLNVEDLDFGGERILIHISKTGHPRVVPLSAALRTHLRRYLIRREQRTPGDKEGFDSAALFLAESGRRLKVDRAEQSMRSLGKLAGVDDRLYPHKLRHTFATISLLSGMPMPAVMRIGGWSKLATVQRYSQFSDALAAEAHKHASPLSKR